jgi:hypothetical protein
LERKLAAHDGLSNAYVLASGFRQMTKEEMHAKLIEDDVILTQKSMAENG